MVSSKPCWAHVFYQDDCKNLRTSLYLVLPALCLRAPSTVTVRVRNMRRGCGQDLSLPLSVKGLWERTPLCLGKPCFGSWQCCGGHGSQLLEEGLSYKFCSASELWIVCTQNVREFWLMSRTKWLGYRKFDTWMLLCSLEKNPKCCCVLCFSTISYRAVKVFARKMQSLLLAVSENACVPSAPKNVLIASLSTLVLPCLRSDFSISLPLTGLGLHNLQTC